VQEYKEGIAYNNIFIECMRTPDKYPTRILGFSINGETPQNGTSLPQGALRGFFLDDKGVFNEIVTVEAVVPLNQWVYVVFVRSLSSGMHIYVNGEEKGVQVTSGTQNPVNPMARGTEFYIGHDSLSTIDELSISTVAITPGVVPINAATSGNSKQLSIFAEWWFWTTIAAGIVFLAGTVLFIKRNQKSAGA